MLNECVIYLRYKTTLCYLHGIIYTYTQLPVGGSHRCSIDKYNYSWAFEV